MADLAFARKVLETEAAAIRALVGRIDARFACAVEMLRHCKGRVILTGMGKSGIIGRKIAATLTSTGTPSFFLHPGDAIHGDLGAIMTDDVVIALSGSGETDELLRLLETIRRLGAKLIAITGAGNSTLAQAADVALDCSVTEEACPLNLVPTASTTAALALGDALAMTLAVDRGFRLEDFASRHPGGTIGKRLMRVEALMHGGDKCPRVHADTKMRDVIYEMSRKGLGMTCVVDGSTDAAELLGIITDGDLRRRMERGGEILDLTAGDLMTRDPISVARHTLAAEALSLMERRKITSVVVVDRAEPKRVAGVLHLHDLWEP
jgi:arabinose-5-phosphate isomerase